MENPKTIECCNCGVLFQVSATLNANWLKTKQTFYCPNGHPQSYIKSTEETLRERIEYKDRAISEKSREIDRLSGLVISLERKVKRKKK